MNPEATRFLPLEVYSEEQLVKMFTLLTMIIRDGVYHHTLHKDEIIAIAMNLTRDEERFEEMKPTGLYQFLYITAMNEEQFDQFFSSNLEWKQLFIRAAFLFAELEEMMEKDMEKEEEAVLAEEEEEEEDCPEDMMNKEEEDDEEEMYFSSSPVPSSSVTVCRNWSKTGSCQHGERCHFKDTHTSENAPAPSSSVTVCRNWSKTGSCQHGERCHFKSTHTSENAPSRRK
jgi:hypothetical protein